MKKTKILGISLSSVTLTTLAIATPIVLASCSNESLPTEKLIQDNFINVNEVNGAKVIRETGTNNFTVYTGLDTLGKPGIINPEDILNSNNPAFTSNQLKILGFNNESNIKQGPKINTKTIQNYKNLKKGDSATLCDGYFILQLKEGYPTSLSLEELSKNGWIEKYVQIPFLITLKIDSYQGNSNIISKNELFVDDCLGWEEDFGFKPPKDSKIIREHGTNNFIIYTGLKNDGTNALAQESYVGITFTKFPHTYNQLKGLGFDPNLYGKLLHPYIVTIQIIKVE